MLRSNLAHGDDAQGRQYKEPQGQAHEDQVVHGWFPFSRTPQGRMQVGGEDWERASELLGADQCITQVGEQQHSAKTTGAVDE